MRATPTRNPTSSRPLGTVLGLLPVVLYWYFVGRVPGVAPEKAKELLADPRAAAVLVDVRSPDEFKRASSGSGGQLAVGRDRRIASADAVPGRFRGKHLLLLCDSGIDGSIAARRLRELGVQDVANVDGGLQTWIASAEQPCSTGLCRLTLASGRTAGLPFRESSWLEQWAVVLTGFVVKPVYTVLALALFVVLWRQKSADLAALRWAMLASSSARTAAPRTT